MSDEWKVLNDTPAETTTAAPVSNEWKPLHEAITNDTPRERTVFLEDKGVTAGYPESMDSRDAEVAIRRDIYQEPEVMFDSAFKDDIDRTYIHGSNLLTYDLTKSQEDQADIESYKTARDKAEREVKYGVIETYKGQGRPLTEAEETQVRREWIKKRLTPQAWDYISGAPGDYSRFTALMSGVLPHGDKQYIEDLAALYPGATFTGKLGQLALISFMTGGGAAIGTGVKGLSDQLWRTPLSLYPKLVPVVAHAVNSGTLWGLGGIIDVIAREPSWETMTHPLSEYALGALIGAPGGLEGKLVEQTVKVSEDYFGKVAKHWNLPEGFGQYMSIEKAAYRNRVIAGALVRGGWEAGKSLMNDGKIDKAELTNIALNASLGAAFEAVNATVVSANLRRSRYINMERIKTEVKEKLVAAAMTGEMETEAGVVKGLARLQEDKLKNMTDDLEVFMRTFKRPDIVMTTEKFPYNISLAPEKVQLNYVRKIEAEVANGCPLGEALKRAGEWLTEKWPEVEFSDELVQKVIPLRDDIYQNLIMREGLEAHATGQTVSKLEVLTTSVRDILNTATTPEEALAQVPDLIQKANITDADLRTLGIDSPEDLGQQIFAIVQEEINAEAARIDEEERLAIQEEQGDTSFEPEETAPIIWYQGGGKTIKTENRVGGVYLTKNKNYAKTFAGEKGEVAETYAEPKKVYDLTDQVVNQPERELLIEAPQNFPNEIKQLRDEGYDAIVYKDQMLVLDPTILKPVTSQVPAEAPSQAVEEQLKESVVRDENGKLKPLYSGHANVEIYGEFDRKKATAGAYYATDDPNIASNYAVGKFGSKEYFENGEQYRIAGKNGKYTKRLYSVQLTPEQIAKIDELKTKTNKYGDTINGIAEMDNYIKNQAQYDKAAARWQARGGSHDLQSIFEFMEQMGYNIAYFKDGTEELPVWERQTKNDFEELLDYIGLKWQSRQWIQPGVQKVFLNIKNPIDTDKPFPKDLLAALEKKAKRERVVSEEEARSLTWTKDFPLREWVKQIKENEAAGETYWATHIPEKALPIIGEYGYDGIKDTGGKGGGIKHQVWIAFRSDQIINAIGKAPAQVTSPAETPAPAKGKAESVGAMAAKYQFDFSLYDAVREPSGSEKSLQAKLMAISDLQERAVQARYMLEEGSRIPNELKHAIRKYKQTETEKYYKKKAFMAEELAALPRRYVSTKDTAMTIDEALDYVNNNLGGNFQNESELIEYLRAWDKEEKNLKGIISDARPEMLTMRKETLLKKELERIAQGARLGEKFTKAQIKKAQRDLRNVIEGSGLEAKDRDKLTRKLINISALTPKVVDDIQAEVYAKLDELETKAKHREAVAALKKTLKGVEISKMDPVYKKAVQALLQEYDLKNYGEAKREELAAIREYIANNPDNNIPDYVLKNLEALDKKPLRDMTAEEIDLLTKTIQHAIKLNDLKQLLRFKQKYVALKEIVDQAVKNVSRGKEIDADPNNITSATQGEKQGWTDIWRHQSWRPEAIVELLDVDRYGPIWEVLYNGVDLGETERLRMLYGAEDFFRENLTNLGINIDKWSEAFTKDPVRTKIELPNGKSIEITPGEKIAIYLHSLNKKNMKHLRSGFYFAKDIAHEKKLTEEDIQNIAGSLTPEEQRVANLVWTYFNTMQNKAINKVSVALDGYEIATEENYFPIRTSSLDRFHDNLKASKNFSHKTLEGQGMLQPRINTDEPLILEDAFVALAKSIHQASAYVGYAEALRGAKMLMDDPDFAKAVIANFGKKYMDNLRDYLVKIEDASHDISLFDKLSYDLLGKAQMSVLGASLSVICQQPLGLLSAFCEIDEKYFRPWDKPTSLAFMSKYSPQIRDRYTGRTFREAGEVMAYGETRQFFLQKYTLSQKLMRGISRFDYEVMGRVWRAVERELRDSRPDLKPGTEEFYKTVAARSEEIMRRTQQTGAMKDRSMISRDPGFWNRIMTTFTSQVNKQYELIRMAIHEYNSSEKTAADKIKLSKRLFYLLIAIPVGVYMVREGIYKLRGGKPRKSGLRYFIISYLENLLSNFYYVNVISNALKSRLEYGRYAGDVDNLMTQLMEDIVNVGEDTVKTAEQFASKEIDDDTYDYKWKKSALRLVDDTLEVSGKLKGINYREFKKWILFVIGGNKKHNNNEGW